MSKKSGRKAKLPKQVGGVPVPKKLRKAAAKVVVAAASPAGMELIAAGLSAAAALASAAVERERVKRHAGVKVGGDTRDAASGPRGIESPRASNDPHEMGVALGRIAEAALTGLFKQRG